MAAPNPARGRHSRRHFLLSRVEEAWDRTCDHHESVAAGLASTGRVISCAALIMIAVFISFVTSANVVIKQLSVGLSADYQRE